MALVGWCKCVIDIDVISGSYLIINRFQRNNFVVLPVFFSPLGLIVVVLMLVWKTKCLFFFWFISLSSLNLEKNVNY